MKRYLIPIVVFLLFISIITVSAGPLFEYSYYDFQPSGEAYYITYGKEITLDKQVGGHPSPSGDFMRVSALINGRYVPTNIRYKIDPIDLSPYDNPHKESKVMVSIDGQIGDSFCENDVVYVYYPKNEPTVGRKITAYLTDCGGWQFGEEIYVSDKNSSLDEEYEKNYNNAKTLIELIKKENVDYSKDTYLYIPAVAGCELYIRKWKIKLIYVDEDYKADIKILPDKAKFDKRMLYSADIYGYFINNACKKPDKILVDGKPLNEENIKDYGFTIPKDLLKDYNPGDRVTVTAYFGNDSYGMEIDIVDTTNLAFKQCFSDVGTHDNWEFINKLYDKKIVYGDENGLFKPKANIKLGEFCLMLARACGAEIEPVGNWYQGAMEWAREFLIIQNDDPNSLITFKEAQNILLRALLNYCIKDIDGNKLFNFDHKNLILNINNIEEKKLKELNEFLPIIPSSKFEEAVFMTRENAAEAIVRFGNLFELLKK